MRAEARWRISNSTMIYRRIIQSAAELRTRHRARECTIWFSIVWGQKILVFGAQARENIDFWWFCVVQWHKILICSALGKEENIEFRWFWWSGDRKYWFLVVWGQKIWIFDGQYWFFVVWGQKILIFIGLRPEILILSGLGKENIDF